MSAAAAYWPGTGRLEALAAFPEVPDLRERGLSDGVGRLYLDMAQRGELVVTAGRAVSVEALLGGSPGAVGAPVRCGGRPLPGNGPARKHSTGRTSRKRPSWREVKASKTAPKTCGRSGARCLRAA